jgi:hypothetical protein
VTFNAPPPLPNSIPFDVNEVTPVPPTPTPTIPVVKNEAFAALILAVLA